MRVLGFVFFLALVSCSSPKTANAPAAKAKPDLTVLQKQARSLVAQMTLEEKAGQMTQITLQAVSKTQGTSTRKHEVDEAKLREAIVKAHVGSILNVYDYALPVAEWHRLITQIQKIATEETRLKIPVLYGIDAIHGANYTLEATLFPQSLGMASAWNPEFVRASAEITAMEVRASGIPWDFNPVLEVGRNPLWPRLWETFGEDTYTVAAMGEAYVQGLQGGSRTPGARHVAACAKHYIGYGVPLSGKDRTPAWIPERMMREHFLLPFKKAVEAGALTVMINSAEVNGIPVHSDRFLLTELLREELGFKGFTVSDWEDIKRLHTRDKVAATPKEAVRMAVMAGVDMSMVPYDLSFYHLLVELAREGAVPEWRLDQAVERILAVKMAVGLFEAPFPDKNLAADVGSKASAEVSLQAARQAIVLLKNQGGVLPLNKNMKVLVTGPAAHSRAALHGGWSYTWQGDVEADYPQKYPTILQAIERLNGKENTVYVKGSEFDKAADQADAVSAAAQADVVVAVMGEAPYTETPGNIHDLTLPQAQLNLVRALAATGKPVILVMIEGRPRLITAVAEQVPGILLGFLPGPRGGEAVAEILFGDTNPSGKLPVTYPKYPNSLHTYDYKPLETDQVSWLFPFGHGLSYTSFAYSDLKLSAARFKGEAGEELQIRVNVKNTGPRAGREVVHLYLRDVYRSISPPVKLLKRFAAVELRPGEEKTVNFTLNREDLAFYGRDLHREIEAGEFQVMVGSQQAPLTESFELTASQILGGH